MGLVASGLSEFFQLASPEKDAASNSFPPQSCCVVHQVPSHTHSEVLGLVTFAELWYQRSSLEWCLGRRWGRAPLLPYLNEVCGCLCLPLITTVLLSRISFCFRQRMDHGQRKNLSHFNCQSQNEWTRVFLDLFTQTQIWVILNCTLA